MRFRESKIGDYRHRSAFLFLPKTIDNETRWLECAQWVEELSDSGGWFPDIWWHPVRWSDQ